MRAGLFAPPVRSQVPPGWRPPSPPPPLWTTTCVFKCLQFASCHQGRRPQGACERWGASRVEGRKRQESGNHPSPRQEAYMGRGEWERRRRAGIQRTLKQILVGWRLRRGELATGAVPREKGGTAGRPRGLWDCPPRPAKRGGDGTDPRRRDKTRRAGRNRVIKMFGL